ncbi:MAG TPA: NAD-dependent succinate-semialdehyde dehydrogenase [Noviherbaspirillum sp.]|uniref:NAD-dependent succinate-semialdehyde dehydrogenase n=1 Tax=Noviherbaspirillum sp. TaxID=1926288 RepID=UPI002B45E926|nr:NAD-dependent succinate-semialdehyde dehydrogenase [Noviherbaspirillum sp.]HJV84238.1 NAD-dependent succinate-semialdehyde dehydrogenase [Noviherbaspirillum sp.]
MQSVNPHSGQVIRTYDPQDDAEVERLLGAAESAFHDWKKSSFADRAQLLKAAGGVLRGRKQQLAELMADEMGKVLRDGVAEIEKCAGCCDFYAENAQRFLANHMVLTDAEESYIAFDPLGPVLAVMPWNFPFWQVFRFAAPALMAGNIGVLKHASNVSGCALAIQDVFREAGFPEQTFTALLVESARVEQIIRHPAIQAVTLTGSAAAGRSVARAAGAELKKTVLELGGSDAYVVLDDARLDAAVDICVKSRLINAGQSCIAAKRFIVHKSLRAQFERAYVERFQKIRYGDPRDDSSDIGPLARTDLRDQVHRQVEESVRQGAKLLTGGQVPSGVGAYYPPTVLTNVQPGMVAFDEEVFGPVAAIIEANDEEHAIALANQSPFGLGAALFTQDKARADRIARRIEAGNVFVNAFVKSDARLPFGGVKQSGYGRELSWFGIQEFVNVKTVYHARVEGDAKSQVPGDRLE